MKSFARLFLLATLMLSAASVFALSDAGQYYITQMTMGGPQSIRSAASSIIQSGERDTDVLDTLAEVLLQNYTQPGNTYIDAMSWACRALGDSGNPRYRSTLEEVTNSKQAHKKLRKYAKKAAKQLPKGDADQYIKGTIDLVALRAENEKTDAARSAEKAEIAASGNFKPITSIVIGMSQSDVYAISGPPTATTSHITGNAWRPFNYKGSDTSRTILLYKGQGRVVLSNTSHYTATFQVIEVLINPNETGYP